MRNIVEIEIGKIEHFLEGRKPDGGAGLTAYESCVNRPFAALAPVGTTDNRARSLYEGGLTEWDETLPALLRSFDRISSKYDDPHLCVPMIFAKEKDFPAGEDFEVESRPYRSTIDEITYVSAPLRTVDDRLFYAFINFDIGFDKVIILLNCQFSENWFKLSKLEKEESILSVAFDIYDGESFTFSSSGNR